MTIGQLVNVCEATTMISCNVAVICIVFRIIKFWLWFERQHLIIDLKEMDDE